MKVSKSDVFVCILILFPICNIIGGIFGYYDELIGLIGLGYLLASVITGHANKAERIIFTLLAAITVLGIVSNICSHVSVGIFPIAVDVLWLWKIYAIFLLFREVSIKKYANNIVNKLVVLAKICVVFVALTAIVGQFADIGVSLPSAGNYGIFKPFGFFWRNAIQTGWLLFSCLLVLAMANVPGKVFIRYLLIATLPLVLTFSSLVYCWLVAEVALLLVLKDKKRFHLIYLLVIAVVVVLFTINDVRSYLLSDTSVRMLFIRYAIVTANRFAPLGSGFATYGSDMAARYYSPLYVEYGWSSTWVLGKNSLFLNDNFLASVLGQFGWAGLVLYIALLGYLLYSFSSTRYSKWLRGSLIATIITIAVSMIGSASAKSMMGCFVFAVLGLSNVGAAQSKGIDDEAIVPQKGVANF